MKPLLADCRSDEVQIYICTSSIQGYSVGEHDSVFKAVVTRYVPQKKNSLYGHLTKTRADRWQLGSSRTTFEILIMQLMGLTIPLLPLYLVNFNHFNHSYGTPLKNGEMKT